MPSEAAKAVEDWNKKYGAKVQVRYQKWSVKTKSLAQVRDGRAVVYIESDIKPVELNELKVVN